MATALSQAMQCSMDLTALNSMALVAKASHFYALKRSEDLFDLIAAAKKQQLEICILGGGSNVLLPPVYNGLLIHMQNKGIVVLNESRDDVTIKVQAGEVWDDFLQYALDHGWYGLENLAIIPGSVGAAPVQNIGAYGQEVAQCIHQVHCFDCITLENVTFTAEECCFSYRDSIFKSSYRGRYIITAVEFKLEKHFQANIAYQPLAQALAGKVIDAAIVRQTVIAIRESKLPSPAMIANCGSFFKNPLISTAEFSQLQLRYPSMPAFMMAEDKVKLAAGWLIEQCGWKGRNLGLCGMYEKQALVLVNHGGACLADVKYLAETVQTDVLAQFNVTLEIEPVVTV